MNDADVLFPWEREGAERDATAPGQPPAETAEPAAAPGSDAPAAEGTGDTAEPAIRDAVADAGAADVAAAEHEPVAAGEPAGDAARISQPDGAEQAQDDGAEQAKDGTPVAGDVDDEARFAVLDTEYARRAAERASAALRENPIAQKEYYSISEVCELVGLKAHVLRYWETQFQVLNPSKNRSGNRVYQRKEIRLITLVKHLLYEEKYTVEGARAKLEQLRRGGELPETAGAVLDRAMIEQLRADLSELTTLLTPPARS